MSHSCLSWETLWQLTYGGRRAYIGRGIGIGILVSIVLDIGMGAYVPLGTRTNSEILTGRGKRIDIDVVIGIRISIGLDIGIGGQ